MNGSASSVVIEYAAALSPQLISIEAWIKTSTGAGTPSIFSKDMTTGTPQNRAWQFRLNGGKPDFIVFNSSSNAAVTSPETVNDNQYHHLFGTWDGANVRMYVDGSLKATTPLAGTLRAGQANSAFIGRSENSTPNYFNGYLDELRLSPVARSADWVRATYDNQKPAATFLTGYPAATPDLDDDSLPDAWEARHFATIFGTDPDPDADGLSSLVEFAFGTDPASGADMPELTLTPASEGSLCEFIFHQIAGGIGDVGTTYTAAGLRYVVEVSENLTTWQSGPTVVAWSTRREALPDGMERVGVNVTDLALGVSSSLYVRLRIVVE